MSRYAYDRVWRRFKTRKKHELQMHAKVAHNKGLTEEYNELIRLVREKRQRFF